MIKYSAFRTFCFITLFSMSMPAHSEGLRHIMTNGRGSMVLNKDQTYVFDLYRTNAQKDKTHHQEGVFEVSSCGFDGNYMFYTWHGGSCCVAIKTVGSNKVISHVSGTRYGICATNIYSVDGDSPQYTKNTKPEPIPAAKETIPPPSGSTGSGFFVSKMGHVITNAHVVKDCQQVTVGDNANTQSPAEVISSDARNDLALLKLSSLDMASSETKALVRKLEIKIVPLASDGLLRSDDVELGEKVLVAGYPYGDIFSNTIKVTGGMVSATRGMGDDTGQFQLDAAVQPGNSGGPIYDGYGNVVGVVVSQLNKLNVAKAIGSMPENVNFGIKASTVRQFLTASGLPSKWSQRSKELSNKQLAKIAQNQALMVVCH